MAAGEVGQLGQGEFAGAEFVFVVGEVLLGVEGQCMAGHKTQCQSLTFDNGKEFTDHAEVGKALQVDTFSAHPYSS